MAILIPTLAERELAAGAPRPVLAIDPGTNAGWAIRHVDLRVASGTLKFAKGSHPGARYRSFRRWLTTINKRAGFAKVWYERKDFIGTSIENARVAFALEGNLLDWCALQRIEVEGVPVGTLKKFTTGRGKAEKHEMIAAMRALGYDPETSDEADALALLHLGLERMEGTRHG